MKRKLLILLALAALIGAIGGGAALAEFTEVADPVVVAATAGSGGLEADLSFTPDAYEIVRRPYGDESADWAHVAMVAGGSSHIEYPLQPTYAWERYDYKIRAFLPSELSETLGYAVVESGPIDVQFEGFTVSFDDYNGGTVAFDASWVGHGYRLPDTYPMEEIRVDLGESCTLPECTIVPPDWKMFDHWALSSDGQSAADAGGMPETGMPGDVIPITADVSAKPVWTDRTFSTAYALEDLVYGRDGRPTFYVESFLIPYYPSDMVEWTHRGNKDPYERNIYIDWYYVIDGARGEKADSLLFYDRWEGHPGNIFCQAEGPYEVGDFELVITYKGVEVVNQFFSITEPAGPQGAHSYSLSGSLDKEYDGQPVSFDPYDDKAFAVDGGKSSWAALAKDGEVRYLWRVHMSKGKEDFWMDMEDGAPTDPGRYALVIQEMGDKDWEDAAIFEFEIAEAALSSFVVAFDPQGGGPAPEAQTLWGGETAAEPADPVKIGAVFTGWYADADCAAGSVYDFDAPVAADITLYAGWLVPEPEGILKLPADLTAIGEEAFSGIAAEAVVIPTGVTSISGDPFAGGAVLYIYGYPGSAAEAFAHEYGYTFVPIDDEWLTERY